MVVALLWVNGLAFLGFGIVSLVSPEFPTNLSGLVLEGNDAPIEVRAQYGGIFLSIASFGLLGAMREAMRDPALLMMCFVYAGLGGGRLVGLIVDAGPAGNYTYAAMGFELIMALVLAALVYRQRAV